MDTFTEDQLDPGIVIADWQGPQPNFSTYGISPPQNRWFAERLLRHFRSIHKRIIAPNGHIQKAMIRDLIAYAPNGHEILGYDPKPGRRQCLFILEIGDFDEYCDRDEYRGIIPELAWRAPIFTGGDPQAEIHFWQEAKVKCQEFFLQSPKGAGRWRMTQEQFLQYADTKIASLETELKESSIPQETSIRQASPELKIESDNDEPRILHDLSPDDRFNEIREFLENLEIYEGKLVWPNKRNHDKAEQVRKFDLALLLYYLNMKEGIQPDLTDWANYGANCFVWQDYSSVSNAYLLNKYNRYNDYVEHLSDGKITRMIKALYV